MYCVEGTDNPISQALTPERDIPNMRAISACVNPALSLNDFILSANDNHSFDIANPPFEKHSLIKMILRHQKMVRIDIKW